MSSTCLAPRPLGAIAMEVVSSNMLFPLIASFLPGAPSWTVEYERLHGHNKSTKIGWRKHKMDSPGGLLPRLAIERGDLRVLKRLFVLHAEPQYLDNPKFRFTDAKLDAIACGALDALEWLHKNTNTKCPQAAMNLAAKNGHNEIVLWLLTRHSGAFTQKSFRAVDQAAKNGHVEVVKTLYANGLKSCAQDTMDQVAVNGHLEVLKFLHEKGLTGCSAATADKVAKNGHLDVLRWLLETLGVGITKDVSYYAVVYDHLDVLRYLCETDLSAVIENQHDIVQKGMRRAVRYLRSEMHVEMLVYLREQVPDAFPWYEAVPRMQPETDAGANCFVPVASTTSAPGAKPMPRRPAARAKPRRTPKLRTQVFLSLEGTPDVSRAD